MKLLQNVTLWFQAGHSDKVYEVDLVETPQGFLVNFRYGRRGATLRDGTKTPSPVSEAEAQQVFDKLIASKKKEGYRETTVAPAVTTAPPLHVSAETPSRLLQQLHAALQQGDTSERPLTRLVWQVGELRLPEAVPLLVQQLPRADELQQYCIVWALGRCGSKDAVPVLEQLYQGKATKEKVRRITHAALLALTDGPTRRVVLDAVLTELPADLAKEVRRGSTATARSVAERHLARPKHAYLLELLYLLAPDFPAAREVVSRQLRTMPLEAGTFRSLRHIFKIAEFRDDAAVFAQLAYRFEKAKHAFRQGSSYYRRQRIYLDGEWVPVQQELTQENSRLAYSERTRHYLRRRVWRTLRRLGERGDADYTAWAAQVLLQFSDAQDQGEVRTIRRSWWDWKARMMREKVKYYDTYAGYLAFNHILYTNSPRYELKRNRWAWTCQGEYQPGQPAPNAREEAFPQLWDKSPEPILLLLSESTSERVLQFAEKVFRANPSFSKHIKVAHLVKMLQQPSLLVNRLALELAAAHYDPAAPDLALVRAMLQSPLVEARDLGWTWVEAQTAYFLHETLLFADLLLSPFADVQERAHQELAQATLPETQTELMVAHVLAQVLQCSSEADRPCLERAALFLPTLFEKKLQNLPLAQIDQLLHHPLPEVQALAGRILLIHQTPVSDLPPELLGTLTGSPHAAVRQVGVALFGKQTDDELLAAPNLLLAFATAPYPEVREAVRPIVQRLAAGHPDFGTTLLEQLLPFLRRKETYEGLHDDLLTLVQEALPEALRQLSPETAWEFLTSRRPTSQRLGAQLLGTTLRGEALSVRQLVRLANHEMLSVRQWVGAQFEAQTDRMKTQPAEALRLLDASWEDARQFGFAYFEQHFDEATWTPELLVSVCDSTRPDVQAFGRKLLDQYFKKEDGQTYLVQLSQHPAPALQQQATQYLEDYAAGKPDVLETLTPYFQTVLSQVNRSGRAKRDVFAFLKAEALKSRAAAEIIAPLITRQSLTMAVADKAACLQILRDLRQAYPDLEQPLSIRSVRTYSSDHAV
ncbi:WGR domain-containing protein [Catalinimonas alkaloidigena]|uniref:WGR domain-containing protein n=1 Tax=Catalinimonas alkaloidigena TaxID=1075417 RepID=A0A1G9GHU2_9BACT|nr:HEAT repeat domain-containing protein [Catalinimonas alkaloidigena]SDL00226.1 WGR domain-containing protein [Catalinimonas alkaloidigena]